MINKILIFDQGEFKLELPDPGRCAILLSGCRQRGRSEDRGWSAKQ